MSETKQLNDLIAQLDRFYEQPWQKKDYSSNEVKPKRISRKEANRLALESMQKMEQRRNDTRGETEVLFTKEELEVRIAAAIKAERERAARLIEWEASECRFDHHGYCQEHGCFWGNYKCRNQEAREYCEALQDKPTSKEGKV